MNPPAALQGAMSQNRKPFTYTPGGLDLSEIKSERMAQRLIRNAMNQGVPEVPMHSIQSPPMSSTPVAIPNFNCLPVQVFPSFNLPANPKSLLRTRSHPDQKEPPVQRMPATFVNNDKTGSADTFNKNMPTYTQINNNRPTSMFEYSTAPSNNYTLPKNNYGSDGYTAPVLPEISYDAEYFRVSPKVRNDATEQEYKFENASTENPVVLDKFDNEKMLPLESVAKVELLNFESKEENCISIKDMETKLNLVDNKLSTLESDKADTTTIVTTKSDENASTNNEQREVKVTKKEVQKENTVEEQNGDQNGDNDVEAELTVTLPTKKTAAKTETKVEVVKKTLPNGSVEEIKTTTTRTTIDGRTEIKTKTETTMIPKEEDEEVVEEEEEEENGEEVVVAQDSSNDKEAHNSVATETVMLKEKEDDNIVKTEERSETTTTTTKKVVVVESPKEDQSEEIDEEQVNEEFEEAEPVTVTIKKEEKVIEEVINPKPVEKDEEEGEEEEIKEKLQEKDQKPESKQVANEIEVEEELEDEEVEEEEEEIQESKEENEELPSKNNQEELEEEEQYEEAEEKENDVREEKQVEVIETKEEKIIEVELESAKEEVKDEKVPTESETTPQQELNNADLESTPKEDVNFTSAEEKPKEEYVPIQEIKIPLREPSIPLEKVEDVEIKPIGFGPGIITKSHTENTEIITSSVAPTGGISRQTEYNKVENIVTVNRTTKILDHNYENITQQGIPTVKTYFPPPSIDRVLSSPLPSRPYQSVYPPEPTVERRHSLLLDRLSVERQIPVETYKYSNQTQDQQTQWQEDPRAEVVEVSNVKPSSITNQQWFQQSKSPNAIQNNVTPSPPTAPSWSQPKPQSQSQYQQYSFSPQPQYNQPSPQPQPQYNQPSPQPQPQYQPAPQTKPQYQIQPQFQPSYSEPPREKTPLNSYSSYTPKPTWASNVESSSSLSHPSQYLYSNKDKTESYQKSTEQFSSSYVPPPWEQDSSYVPDNSTQTYYQSLPQTTSFAPTPTQSWKPPPSNKYTKPAPISYVPPAPNQSFVKSVTIVEPPNLPGRKTYYSEYERRYITVPESTYVPTETKYQPQPDPSPQYYYDNNEPMETVEPQWRKELREFTENTSQIQTEQTNVKPPWEAEPKYAKNPSSTYTPTPTWSQTLRPRSWRERSFESEYVGSQEWPKANTLGRGRPLSSFNKNVDAIPERPRGVSVDRYNPNSYHSPSEHPPVQSHTLTTPAPHASYHNPNVPAYHARASAEPRDHPTPYQQRVWSQARASPIQSRSFKYLQWITGTDD